MYVIETCFLNSAAKPPCDVRCAALSDIEGCSGVPVMITNDGFGAAATLSARNSLRITQSDFKYIACGYPVPIRLHWASSGGWKGVAALSKHPTRAQPVGWDDGIKHSSRALVTSSLVQNMWITAGTIYGETAGLASATSFRKTTVCLVQLPPMFACTPRGFV